MSRFAVIVNLCAAMLLAACGTTVETQVDAFSSISTDSEPKTIFLLPFRVSDADDLQWAENARMLAAELSERGYTVVDRKGDARLVAYFGYSIDQGERVQSTYSIPQYGVTGYSGANTYGSVVGNTYSSTTTLNPTYGITGYSSGVATSIVYTRTVAIDMFDGKSGKKVFQAVGVSRGSCGSFSPVSGPILEAMLSKFPEGHTGRVSVPMETQC